MFDVSLFRWEVYCARINGDIVSSLFYHCLMALEGAVKERRNGECLRCSGFQENLNPCTRLVTPFYSSRSIILYIMKTYPKNTSDTPASLTVT